MVVLLLGLIALGAVAPALAQPAEADIGGTLTLRLRDAPLGDVVFSLFELTGQGFVVDADVVGRADVELIDKTPAEVEQALEGFGLSISDRGRLRRVTAGGRAPTLQLPGTGHPISFSWRQPVDMREFLQLIHDVTGDEILAPTGQLGRVLVFTNEVPVEDLMSAALASARLGYKREGARVLVSCPADPDAVLLPVNTGGRHYGHVPYREGEGR